MKKIPTVLVRDRDEWRVTDEVAPGCEWVLAGEGVATRKYDGTCLMLDAAGDWWARREVKAGKTPPTGFRLEQHDDVTGKSVGWEPLAQSPFAKFHAEAVEKQGLTFRPGTYELIGPKINGNPEKQPHHLLVPHSHAEVLDTEWHGPRTVASIKALVRVVGESGWEGVVWHHPDGRMGKLKARDL